MVPVHMLGMVPVSVL